MQLFRGEMCSCDAGDVSAMGCSWIDFGGGTPHLYMLVGCIEYVSRGLSCHESEFRSSSYGLRR